jgi:hypothetical protein
MRILITLFVAASFLFASCGEKEKGKRRGINFKELKPELALTTEQEQQFDAVVEKYTKIAEESRAAASSEGGKMDRVAMFAKMEEMRKQQAEEMKVFLDSTQFEKYNTFIAKNTRKRPGYSNELLEQMKTELALDEQQATMLEAVNKTFEKSYHDAHDFYHGNNELAKEYWVKYDDERKAALKQVFSEEQYAKYLDLAATQGFVGRE